MPILNSVHIIHFGQKHTVRESLKRFCELHVCIIYRFACKLLQTWAQQYLTQLHVCIKHALGGYMCVIALILHTFIDVSSCMHADTHMLHTCCTLILHAHILCVVCVQIVCGMCVLAFCIHCIYICIYRIFVFI